MCKSVQLKRPLGGMARFVFAVVLAALFAALVLAGCGGDKGNPAGSGTNAKERTLTFKIDPHDTSGNIQVKNKSDKKYKTGDTIKVTAGDSITLEAVATGYKQKFIEWSGSSLLNTVNPVTFAVNNNLTITARFKSYYTLTVNAARGGTVSYGSKTDYIAGDTVTVTATPNAGYTFDGWSGDETGTTNPLTVTVNGDKNLTANFKVEEGTPDSCTADPYKPGCPAYIACQANPTPGCPNYVAPPDQCVTNPSAPGCPEYCTANPTAQGCPQYCTANPSAQGCPGYCSANPYAPGCQQASGYTLEVKRNPEAGGVVTYESKAFYEPGEPVTLTAAANAGYVFTGWSGASTAGTPSVTVIMNGNKTLTANFQLRPEGHHALTVIRNPEQGGTVSWVPNQATYADGAKVTLTATAAAEDGWEFAGWSGASDAVTDTVTITMDKDTVISADFRIKEYTLTTKVADNSGGQISRSPVNETYIHGELVTVEAKPDSGYVFTGWTGAATGMTNPVQIKMTRNDTLTARFGLMLEGHHRLTVNIIPLAGGAVSAHDPTYLAGTPVSLTATANVGYTFDGWSGASTAATPTVTVTMDSDKTITANFLQKTYTLITTVTPAGAGSIDRVPDKTTYYHGETVTLTASPNAGYRFNQWTTAGSDPLLEFTMNGDKHMTAEFQQEVNNCTANPTAPGCQAGSQSYCRYGGDPSDCWPIGAGQDAETDAACIANYGEVVSSCDGVSSLQYCDYGPPATVGGVIVGGCWQTTTGTCSEGGSLVDVCPNYPPPTEGGYCDYGFGNCIPSSVANCNQYGAFTASCPASNGYYCDYGQPTKYSAGGCYFKPNISPSGTKCGPAGDGDLEYANVVTQAACETSNTSNGCIADPKKPADKGGPLAGTPQCDGPFPLP